VARAGCRLLYAWPDLWAPPLALLQVKSINFSPAGDQLLTVSEDMGLRVYDTGSEGELKKTLFAKKFGVGLARFLHDPSCVVCASSNQHQDHALRYWSVHNNCYLRYFKGAFPPHANPGTRAEPPRPRGRPGLKTRERRATGHKAPVVSLHVSPKDDTFISASADGQVRLWDVRQDECTGLIRLANNFRPSVSYDPSGKIFAATVDSNCVNLYSAESPNAGPFLAIEHKGVGQVNALKFSADGAHLLLCGE
jgi:COMPASS component SWD2